MTAFSVARSLGCAGLLLLGGCAERPEEAEAVAAESREAVEKEFQGLCSSIRRSDNEYYGELQVEEGSLYPALHRMERRDWIRAEWGQSELNRRAKYYSLTRSGKRRLAEQEATWQRLSSAIEQVLATEEG